MRQRRKWSVGSTIGAWRFVLISALHNSLICLDDDHGVDSAMMRIIAVLQRMREQPMMTAGFIARIVYVMFIVTIYCPVVWYPYLG